MAKRSVCDEWLGLQLKAQHVGTQPWLSASVTQTEQGDLGRVLNEPIPGRHRGSRSMVHEQGWQNICHIPFRRNSVAGDSTVTCEHMYYTSICINVWQAGLMLLSVITCENTDFSHQYFTRSTRVSCCMMGGDGEVGLKCVTDDSYWQEETKPWQMRQPVFSLSGCSPEENRVQCSCQHHEETPLRNQPHDICQISHLLCNTKTFITFIYFLFFSLSYPWIMSKIAS